MVHAFAYFFSAYFSAKGFGLQVVLVGAIIGSYFTLSIMAAPASPPAAGKRMPAKICTNTIFNV